MKTSLNLPRRLFVVIDGNTTDPAADKGAPEAQKAMAEATANAIAPERAAPQSLTIFSNFNLLS